MPLVSSMAGTQGYGRIPATRGNTNFNVLLLWDVDNANTASLVTYLTNNGYTVTKVFRNNWTGSNPSLTNIGSVIMLNGASATYTANLATSVQTTLVSFVNTGGKFITQEWSAYQVYQSQLTSMTDLILGVRTSGSTATRTYTIQAGYTSHPLFTGLTSPIAIPNTGYNVGGVRTFASSPATAIALDQSGNAAVIIRNYGLGKVVYFNHASNYTAGVLSNTNVQRLYLNALNW